MKEIKFIAAQIVSQAFPNCWDMLVTSCLTTAEKKAKILELEKEALKIGWKYSSGQIVPSEDQQFDNFGRAIY